MGYFWDFQLAIQQIWYNCSSTVGPKTSLNYGTGTALYGRGQLGAIWVKKWRLLPFTSLVVLSLCYKGLNKKITFSKEARFWVCKKCVFYIQIGKMKMIFQIQKTLFCHLAHNIRFSIRINTFVWYIDTTTTSMFYFHIQ